MEPTPDPQNKDNVLPAGIFLEFKTALQEEIAAIRRNGSAPSFRLKNGRFIARIGSRFQYTFEMEAPLGLFWDSPADLYLPDRPPLGVTLLSAVGLTLTANLPEHMGDLIQGARVHYNLSDILTKWIERLEQLRDRPNPAGERIRGALPVSGTPSPLPAAKDLDAQQARAVASALGHDATFILGPPGTGKIHTIAEIARLLYKKNCSVLITAHSCRGADQILLEVSRRIPASEREKGRIIRVGDPQALDFRHHTHLLLETQAAVEAKALLKRKAHLTQERRMAEARSAKVCRMIDILAWLSHGKSDLQEMGQELINLQKKKQLLDQKRCTLKELSKQILFWREAAEEANRIKNIASGATQLAEHMATLNDEISDLAANLDALVTGLTDAQNLYDKTASAGWLSRQLRQLPPPEQQKDVVDELAAETALLREMIDAKKTILKTLENKKEQFDSTLEAFNRTYPGGRDDILKKQSLCQAQYESLSRETKNRNKAYHSSRIRMAGLLSARLKSLNSWGLATISGGTPEIVLNAVKEGYASARSETSGLDLDSLRRELKRLENDIAKYREELKGLARKSDTLETDTDIGEMEKRVIAEAAVIVTTLSSACLNDVIQSRKFDTVIIDDASMAPIPSVWIAAGLATGSTVVLGNPNQLAPVVISDGDMARKWLGRDVFETAGFIEGDTGSAFRIRLHPRYRRHPHISALANEMLHPRRLSDGKTQPDAGAFAASGSRQGGNSLPGWHNSAWGHDSPILLIDTGPSNAWITRVAGDAMSDRLNFISAALCVSTAAALMREDRAPLAAGDNPRMLIIVPYASHAALVNLMIRHEQLENDIHAGTPESLHAAHAPVVILDMVEDDPYSSAPMFRPKEDSATLQLINAVLTRAQSRLIVVGDLEHIEKRARGAVAGSRFVPALKKRSAVTQARDLIRDRRPARPSSAATDHSTACRATGGRKTNSPRFKIFQRNFFESLKRDIEGAAERVVIYSPALYMGRLSELKAPLLAAMDNRVRAYVITRPLKERRKSEAEAYRLMEQTLSGWGVTVIHQMRMHEKLVFIDDRAVWFGSFDPLGSTEPPKGADFRGTMVRHPGQALVNYAAQRLRLNDLVGAHDDGHHPQCPICGNEIVAAVGRHLPFYWRCIENRCYSRTIDQPPPATAEKDAIRCTRCNGEVEFGRWGKKPYWRCLSNRRHRQPIARTHLTTPETVRRIPAEALAGLMKDFGIGPTSP